MPNANLKPRFEVHKLEGTAIRRVCSPKKDKEGSLLGGFDYEDLEVDAGWMIYFPSGSSIRVWTQEEMERQGFDKDPTLVDMETGDESAPMGSSSLKAKSEQVNNRSRSSRAATTHN